MRTTRSLFCVRVERTTCRSSRSRSNSSTDARITRIPDEPFAFQMKNNLLSRLVGSQPSGIDGDVRISRFFVRVGDASKLLDNTGAGFGVETFAIAVFANFYRSGEMHHDKPTQRRDHGPHFFS